jgi:hypothetical protein
MNPVAPRDQQRIRSYLLEEGAQVHTPELTCRKKGCEPYRLAYGVATGVSLLYRVMVRPSLGSLSPVGSVTSPSPYRSASSGTAVLSSIYWSLNRNLQDSSSSSSSGEWAGMCPSQP